MNRAALSLVLLTACAARPATGESETTASVSSESEASSSSVTATSESEDGPSTFTTVVTTGDGEPGDGDPTGDGDATGDGDSGGDCEEPPKLDLPPDYGDMMPDACTVELMDWDSLPSLDPDCGLCEYQDWCSFDLLLGCVDAPGGGQTCEEICPSGNCLMESWTSCQGEEPWEIAPEDHCGPYEIDGKCCTVGKFFLVCAE